LDDSPIALLDRLFAKYADGVAAQRLHHHGSEAWREAATENLPETWQAERVALQARITGLDPAQDEAVLDLSQDEAA